MKIIKFGEDNQKKFVCRCGCEFIADKSDISGCRSQCGTHISWGNEEKPKSLSWAERAYVNCPMCAYEHIWANGETYNN